MSSGCCTGTPPVIGIDGPVTGIWQDPVSGIVVIAGDFFYVNGVSRIGFAIFDSGLNLLPRQYAPGTRGSFAVSQAAFDSSSNIYVAGGFQGWDSIGAALYDTTGFQGMYMGIVKLSPDGGTPDGYVGTPTLFTPPLVMIAGLNGVFTKSSGRAFDFPSAIVPAGSTMVIGGGSFTGYGSNTVQGVVIINHDGSFNAGTGTAQFCGQLTQDGSGGWYGTQGSGSFFHNDAVYPSGGTAGGIIWYAGNSIALQGSNVIMYGGGLNGAKLDTGSGYSGPDSLCIGGIVRVSGGIPDTGFGTWNTNANGGGGWGAGFPYTANTFGPEVVTVDQSTLKLYCTKPNGGPFISYGGTISGGPGPNGLACNSQLVRLNSDGSLDTGWTGDLGGGTGNAICILANGYILVGGTFTQSGPHGSLTTGKYLTLFSSSGTKIW